MCVLRCVLLLRCVWMICSRITDGLYRFVRPRRQGRLRAKRAVDIPGAENKQFSENKNGGNHCGNMLLKKSPNLYSMRCGYSPVAAFSTRVHPTHVWAPPFPTRLVWAPPFPSPSWFGYQKAPWISRQFSSLSTTTPSVYSRSFHPETYPPHF